MSIQGVNYTLLYSAAKGALDKPDVLEKTGITSSQLTELIQILAHAMQGNPSLFESTPDLVAQAYRLLETSSTFSFHPSTSATLYFLRPIAKKSAWARHAAGSSGIFAESSVFIGKNIQIPDIKAPMWFGLPPEIPPSWRSTISALYYINHWISAPYFLDILLGIQTFETSAFVSAYNFTKLKRRPPNMAQDSPEWQAMRGQVPEEKLTQPAFENFVDAYTYLASNPAPLSLERYYEIHKRVADSGIEDVKPENLGRPRPEGILIDFTSHSPFVEKDIALIRSNPYLLFIETGREGNKVFGQLIYPDPRYLVEVAIGRVSTVDSRLAEEIRGYQASHNVHQHWEPAPELLTRKTIEALLKERIDWFNTERAKMGEMITPDQLDRFLLLAAEFHRDLIAIHPFEDVNGRSTRLFVLYDTLAREDIPPPRLHNSSDDINLTVEELARAIKVGIERSKRLYTELMSAAREGRMLESVAPIFFPSLPEDINETDFLAWAKTKLQQTESLRDLYLTQPHEAVEHFVSSYTEEKPKVRGYISVKKDFHTHGVDDKSDTKILRVVFEEFREGGGSAQKLRDAVEFYLNSKLGRRLSKTEIRRHLSDTKSPYTREVRQITGATEADFAEVVKKMLEVGAFYKKAGTEAKKKKFEEKVKRK